MTTTRLLLCVIGLAACGRGPEERAVTGADTATTDEQPADTGSTGTPVLRFRPVWVHASRVDFPHGPHQRLACSSCHERVPNHARHGDVTCRDCHPVPAEVARTTVPDETECLTCHHVRRRAIPCATCHQPDEVDGPRRVTGPMRVAAWDAPRPRDFTFDHQWHGTKTCRDCHEPSVTNAPVAECRSCHESHHTPEATCGRCHQPAAEGVHGDAVHQGCDGRGCHTNREVLQLPPTRSLCLTCHPGQQNHEPDGDCASCHGIRPGWRGGRGP